MQTTGTYRITARVYANGRTLPSTRTGIDRADIPTGTLVQVVGWRDTWAAVRHENGVIWFPKWVVRGIAYPHEDSGDIPSSLEIIQTQGDYAAVADPLGILWVWGGLLEFVDDTPPPLPIEHEDDGRFRFKAWPTEYKRITQAYNNNPDYYSQFGPKGRKLTGHEGADIRATHGSKVFAVADGTVAHVGDDRANAKNGGHNYGVRVYIEHEATDGVFTTVYAHLDSREVNKGDVVTAGQQIGTADNTGNSFGDHLHLTLKKAGATASGETAQPYDIIDPTPYLERLL